MITFCFEIIIITQSALYKRAMLLMCCTDPIYTQITNYHWYHLLKYKVSKSFRLLSQTFLHNLIELTFCVKQMYATGCMCMLLVSSWPANLVCVSGCHTVVLLVPGVGVHAVSHMSPDVVCHHTSDCPHASQFGFSESFKNVFIPLFWE